MTKLKLRFKDYLNQRKLMRIKS